MLHDEFMVQLRTRKSRFSKRRLQFKNGHREVYQWTVPFYSADGKLRGLSGRLDGHHPASYRERVSMSAMKMGNVL